MVSVRVVLLLVVAGAFILAGGVGIASGAIDRLRFEAESVRTSLNRRGDENL